EEQILVPAKRTRRLFTGMDLGIDGSVARKIIRRSFMDLEYPAEVEEFGIAVYMDRPLGFSKTNNEPDQTPLLSYELFSKSLVLNRLQFLRDHPALGPAAAPVPEGDVMSALRRAGLSLQLDARQQRLGVVCIEDAARIADDFVLLR